MVYVICVLAGCVMGSLCTELYAQRLARVIVDELKSFAEKL